MPVLAAAADYEDLGEGLWAVGCFRFLGSSLEDAHGSWSGLGAAALGTRGAAGLHAGMSAILRAVLYAAISIRVRRGLLDGLQDRLVARLDTWRCVGLNEWTNGSLMHDWRFDSGNCRTSIHAIR